MSRELLRGRLLVKFECIRIFFKELKKKRLNPRWKSFLLFGLLICESRFERLSCAKDEKVRLVRPI